MDVEAQEDGILAKILVCFDYFLLERMGIAGQMDDS